MRVGHHRPEPGEPGVELGRGLRRASSFARCSAAMPSPVASARATSSAAVAERMRHRRPAVVARRAVEFAGGQHEAAADRIVGLLQVQVAGGVPGRQLQAVGVAGQRRAVVEDEVLRRVVAELRQAGRRDPAGRGDPRQRLGGAGGVEVAGIEAGEPEHHRAVGGMALAGEGEAAVQPAAEPRRLARRRGCGPSPERSAARKRPAATIGPIVCEEEGPTPTLKMSKTLRNMRSTLDRAAAGLSVEMRPAAGAGGNSAFGDRPMRL